MILCFALYALLLASGQQSVAKPVQAGPPTVPSQAPVSQPVSGVSGAAAQTVNQPSESKPDAVDFNQAPVGGTRAETAPDRSASSTNYIIGPQDNIEVSVWKEPGISGTFPVRPDGMISLSLVGEVTAAGKTPRRLGDEIAVRLKKYIADPSVNVVVLGVYPKQVYLLGEVAHIGARAITPEMTPLQAIAAAGGVTPFAKTKNIYILRGEQGKQQKIQFNYKKAIKDGNQQGVTLVAGDTIVVP